MTQPIIVLDRDGVINQESDDYIKSDAEWLPINGSIDAIARLSKTGFRIAIATNQSGLARGLFDEYALARMHQKLVGLVEHQGGAVAAICFCPHLPDAGCRCRKPATGLLEQIQLQLGTPLAGSYFVGDSEKDLQAAVNFAMRPVLVRTGKGMETEIAVAGRFPDLPVYNDLAAAVEGLGLVDTPVGALTDTLTDTPHGDTHTATNDETRANTFVDKPGTPE